MIQGPSALRARSDDDDTSSDGSAELERILAAGDLTAVFAPIVDLTTGEAVGFEALPCGPVGSPLQRTEALVTAANAAGRGDELDRIFRAQGLRAVVDSGLAPPHVLFVNREPSGAAADASAAVQLLALRRRGLRAVITLTERDLSRDPVELLAFADAIRAAGMGIALDVGVGADSLALTPFLMPDVIKLDENLLRRRPDGATSQLLSAVRVHAERRGAVILAEGIDTREHRRLAEAMGATLGQGPMFGEPGALPTARGATAPLPSPSRPLVLRDADPRLAEASPFEMASAAHRPMRAPADLLLALRQQLEEGVWTLRGLVVVLLSNIDGPHLSVTCRGSRGCDCAERYTALTTAARFVAALGAAMPEELVPGLRGSPLAPDDPVGDEWNMVVVSPYFTAAIVAEERQDAHPEEGRAFDYVMTYDRDLVIDIARTMMTRALPHESPRAEIEAVLAAPVRRG